MAEAVAAAIAEAPAPGGRGRHRRGQELRLPGAGHPGRRPGAGQDEPGRRVVISTHTISLQEQLIAKRPAAAAERDAGGVLGRAGQGAAELHQPAAAGQRPGPRRQPLQRRRGVRPAPPARGLGQADRRRLAVGPRFPPAAGGLGRSGQRPRQLHGPGVPALQGLLLLPGPAADEPCPNPGRQPRPVLHRPGLAAAKARASCPSTTSWSSTKPTRWRPSPATTWALRITNGQVEFTLRQALQRPHQHGPAGRIIACARRRSRSRSAATGPTASSTTWPAGWPSRTGGNGRVRQPKIVANALSEGLAQLAAHGPPRRPRRSRSAEERQDLIAAADRLRRPGRGHRAVALPAAGRGRLLDRGRARAASGGGSSRWPPRHGRRPHPPRANSSPRSPTRDHDQRHAGHGRAVRLLPIARRPAADRRRCAWAAPSTTSGRPNWSCRRACPTRPATRRATSRRRSR